MVAKKKVGRPAKKNPVAKKTTVKRGRPAKKKDSENFEYDANMESWRRVASNKIPFTTSDRDLLNSAWIKVRNVSIRIQALEDKIAHAERAGAKIQEDLEQWRKISAPKWKARQPSDGKPAIAHAKVLIMTRDGEKSSIPCSVDAYSWGELGDRTIIAYAVV